ncbi:hypothetical protein Pelo_18637 [Pelomyxa schiedti]|nr:hypothetical protein Pelo_18637 [Pelomyxa schiedti]
MLAPQARRRGKKKTMEFVVGGATLRACDQLGALASAPTTSVVLPPRAKPVRRWRLRSARDAGQRRDGGVVVCEQTAELRNKCEVVNTKWMVILGCGERSGENELLVHRFNDDRNRIGGFSTFKVPTFKVPVDFVADGSSMGGGSCLRSLLVTVIGRDDWRNRAGDRSLCVRVSPLLLSVVGEIQDRAPAWSTLWVDDTRYLWDRFDSDDLSEVQSHSGGGVCAAVVQPRTKPVRKWRLYSDAGLGRRDDSVVVCEEPVGFIHECKAANSKWLVLLGRGESGGEKVLLVHRFDRCRNMIGEFSHYKVPLDLIADGDTLRGAPTPIRFDGQRPDELLLVVVRKSRSADTSIVASVIDVEQTHSNGTLCVLSTTSWPSPFACLTSTFMMRKKSGARCFICTEHISVPRTGTEYLDGCKMCGFAVEETTGRVTPLAPYTWFDPNTTAC